MHISTAFLTTAAFANLAYCSTLVFTTPYNDGKCYIEVKDFEGCTGRTDVAVGRVHANGQCSALKNETLTGVHVDSAGICGRGVLDYNWGIDSMFLIYWKNRNQLDRNGYFIDGVSKFAPSATNTISVTSLPPSVSYSSVPTPTPTGYLSFVRHDGINKCFASFENYQGCTGVAIKPIGEWDENDNCVMPKNWTASHWGMANVCYTMWLNWKWDSKDRAELDFTNKWGYGAMLEGISTWKSGVRNTITMSMTSTPSSYIATTSATPTP
ncbi:hypothetical protein N7474_007901 [Penicillium riverlandense]|uniref:uncharacterized protein n=1 Tax=Penicillium riverlandense TaxID=1903569 RepID=UPI0025479DBE|nr:uncharacterized protein N7474_007901 [Penicillium riverlandense]KAJ5811600.1 hypothetical protein N7474_007901 [Penicillium riverlandense]